MSIVLIGFMGSGKSTLGKQLSLILSKPFIDLDAYIEADECMTISDIFKLKGESYFREKENLALKKFIHRDIVLSTGGGIIENPNNKTLFLKNKCNFWVDTNFETLYNRIVGDLNRPNAISKSYEELLILYKSRISRYNEIAYIRVDTSQSIQTCCNDIVNKIISDENG
ncbi:shikimate kinase [Macrococcus sp. DPC7161]|uniref:shikimate kinase n=1 Tax=Macrococcus sp. DPC7161 TaxID=2507060 RepID=UPI00100AC153|nr:shikimate kinase [Macrococcus sp. DPC7161]RXK19349.1 shikimate kinase [Macrococcus sp. DPC7161]